MSRWFSVASHQPCATQSARVEAPATMMGPLRECIYLPTGVGSARSSMTWAFMPNLDRFAPSINPAGPAPTMQTWVCDGTSGMLLRRVMRSTQFAPMTPSVVSTLPSWLRVLSELVSSIPGAMVVHHARGLGRMGRAKLVRRFHEGHFAGIGVVVGVKSLFRNETRGSGPVDKRREGRYHGVGSG